MLKLSLRIFFIVCLFDPSIQQYSKACIDKNYGNFSNNYCSEICIFPLTYYPDICKNSMIISPIIPATPSKNQNWNEYIVVSGSSLADQKNNIIKSVKIPVEENRFSQLVLSEFLFVFSVFLFTISFFISLAQ